jgi:hypothetical protein
MKMSLEAELHQLLSEIRREHLESNPGKAFALASRCSASISELRRGIAALYGPEASATMPETCPRCSSTAWRREGPSGIACEECGTLAAGVLISDSC